MSTKKPVRTMLSIQATPDISSIRTAELFSQEHTVIPCIALVEGVLWPANAPGPELALAEEFGRFPAGWNGRPVTYGHPMINGTPVSASSPDVLQDNSFGQLFNTELKGGKLHTEIWINEARIKELSEDAQLVIQGLKNGDGIAEVSTGLFTMQELVGGDFNGKEYSSIWRNIVPDHLAVLPDGVTGACSVADGAGAPRLNQGMEGCMRANQLSPEMPADDEPNGQKGLFKRLMDLGAKALNFRDNSVGISDNDLRTAIYAGLRAMTEEYIYVLAVYSGSASNGTFVYESGWDGTLFENTYTIDAGGSISIGSAPVQVRPMTTFIPVAITTNVINNDINPSQESDMNEKLVNDLIANAATQYTEDDREWLKTLDENQLNKMVPAEVKPIVVEKTAVVEPAPVTNKAETAPEAKKEVKPISTDDYIKGAPEEVQMVLNAGLKMHRERKAALIAGLIANKRCVFTTEQLEAKSVEELQNLSLLATGNTFEGAAATLTQNQEADSGYTPAVNVFSLHKSA
jgi:hypothetical protein